MVAFWAGPPSWFSASTLWLWPRTMEGARDLLEPLLYATFLAIQDCILKFSLELMHSFLGLDVGPRRPHLCTLPWNTLDMLPFLLPSPF